MILESIVLIISFSEESHPNLVKWSFKIFTAIDLESPFWYTSRCVFKQYFSLTKILKSFSFSQKDTKHSQVSHQQIRLKNHAKIASSSSSKNRHRLTINSAMLLRICTPEMTNKPGNHVTVTKWRDHTHWLNLMAPNVWSTTRAIHITVSMPLSRKSDTHIIQLSNITVLWLADLVTTNHTIILIEFSASRSSELIAMLY